ncbi:23S rRNA pseudouridine(1911/1915/1917) synthase RluD [Chitiniphilus purpureus]|uniref:Pseudouridine synthase n=1 Tax=Chitiniphilus purpureus TaxID=2981137 RepID=A0ABY6DRY0_9NEIS|nr:23S rRNA pseudouridine(1911/1915/1917) synthase RluD [Chitiniphilus sp. CD1]UXY17129.1 23S rRNA pseudouridine(1911/1915/1917) synthase RluD [Chitiniphilus sp. CD1]
MVHPELESDDYNDFAEQRVLTAPPSLAGERLDAALAKLLPEYSRSRLAQWIRQNLVTVDGVTVDPKHKLWGGEQVTVQIQPLPEDAAFSAEPVALDVVYEDSALLVLNKPAGLVVHPGSGNWSGTVLNGLLHRYPELKGVPRAGIVHRLDKDTSGLMVVARTLIAQHHLVRQLQARTVQRLYLAVAQGLLDRDGTVDAPIGRHPRERTRMAVTATGKPAVTHYRVLERFSAHTLVQCKLETGRTHQIRVHMAHLGYPLAADALYNTRPRLFTPELNLALQAFARQALHARQLALVHPQTGRPLQWKAPLPDDFADLLAALRAEEGLAAEWEDDEDDEDGGVEVLYVRD